MADWLAIKAEYISTGISTRALAEKHGVSASALMKHSAAEQWSKERKKQASKVEARVKQKIASVAASHAAGRITRLLCIGDNIAERLEEATTKTPLENYDFKTYTVALKNLHDVAKSNEQSGNEESLRKARELLEGLPSAID